MKVSVNIRNLRVDNDLSQEDLAKKIEVTQRSISNWEQGLNEPKASSIIALAEVFNVTTDQILGVEPKKETSKVPQEKNIQNTNVIIIDGNKDITIKIEK